MSRSRLFSHLYSILDILPELQFDAQIGSEKRNAGPKNRCNDFLRLEYLASCKLMQDALTADRNLPYVPSKLYPALFQALTQNMFSTWVGIGKGPRSATCLSLIVLMEHWPYDEFTLQKLVPSLPVSLAKINTHKHLDEVIHDITKFCIEFFNLLPHAFLLRYAAGSCKEKTGHMSHLSKLDLSGYPSYSGSCLELKNLEMKVRNSYNPNSPSPYERRVLVIDSKCTKADDETQNSLSTIFTIGSLRGAGLIIKFRRFHILSADEQQLINFIEILAKNNAPEYLELEACEISDKITHKLISLSHVLKGVSLAYSREITSIQCLSLMSHLRQLDLSGLDMHGKLLPLTQLHRGLELLKLTGCNLRSTDIDVISGSHHTKSLQELDLSSNSFGNPTNAASLCFLCSKLEKVLVLELCDCNLHKNSPENIGDILEILKNIPKLRWLNITDNDFSLRVIRYQVVQLAGSTWLQYICLTVPSGAYLSDDYTVVDNEIRKLKTDVIDQCEVIARSQGLSSKPQLIVEWFETYNYSHWYYSV